MTQELLTRHWHDSGIQQWIYKNVLLSSQICMSIYHIIKTTTCQSFKICNGQAQIFLYSTEPLYHHMTENDYKKPSQSAV